MNTATIPTPVDDLVSAIHLEMPKPKSVRDRVRHVASDVVDRVSWAYRKVSTKVTTSVRSYADWLARQYNRLLSGTVRFLSKHPRISAALAVTLYATKMAVFLAWVFVVYFTIAFLFTWAFVALLVAVL